MNKECREVPTNLLPVNCFLRDTVTAKDLHTEYQQRTYMELQRKTVQNGIVEELKEVPYEITPASVKSFANSSDYHVDPAGAILRGNRGKNLGDVSAVQKVASMDSMEAAAMYAELKKKFETAKQEPQPQPQQEPQPQPQPQQEPQPQPQGGSVNG